MKTKELKNKKGELLTNMEGETLKQNKLEEGDEFIPVYNNVLEKVNEAEIDGEKKKITNYSIKAKVKDKKGNKIKQKGEEEIFIALTPAQAKSMKRKAETGIELNQHKWVAYTYENDYGKQIGVGIQRAKKDPIDWEDITEEDIKEEETE